MAAHPPGRRDGRGDARLARADRRYVLVGYVAAFFLYYSVGAHVGDPRVVAATAAFGVAVSILATAIAGAGVGEYAGAILAVVAPTGVGVLVRDQRRRGSAPGSRASCTTSSRTR